MDIEGLIRKLGPVDASALTETVLAQEEAAWHEDDYRQETYDVHRQTESIVLVFTPLKGWPEIDIHKINAKYPTFFFCISELNPRL